MNNSRKPRAGVSPDSVSDKKSGKTTESPARKSTAKKSGVKNTRKRHHIPEGFPGAGRFTSLFSLENYYWPEQKRRKKAARRIRDNERKKETRARRAALLAKPDAQHLSKKEFTDLKRKKSIFRTDTAALHETQKYAWYGLFRIHGSRQAVLNAAEKQGSDPRRLKPTQNPDGSWSLLQFAYFQMGTPSEAEGFLESQAEQVREEIENGGAASAYYLGAAWEIVP